MPPRPDAVIDAALRQLHSGHGSELLAGWNIPEVFCEVAAHHHDADFDRDNTTLVIVRLVNAACHQEGIGDDDCDDPVADASEEAQLLGLGEIQIAELQVVLGDAATAN